MARSQLEERDWSELPADLVCKCAGRLQCDQDRMTMQLQCRAWRQAMRMLPRSRQLPWMLVPNRLSGLLPASVIRTAHFFCFLSARAHRMPIPPFVFGARFIGGVEGGWVLMAFGHSSGYSLVHFRSGSMFPIPGSLALPPATTAERVVLRAAAFSCSPSESSSCVVACIVSLFEPDFVSRTLICFSRLGATVHSSALEMQFEDVIYFAGSFYCLTKLQDMVLCKPEFDKSSPADSLRIRKSYLDFESQSHGVGLFVKSRYLVESRDELLMVVRYRDINSSDTSSFALFRAVPQIPNGTRCTWERLPSLGGRMVFVARGCSRCFEAIEYPGRHEGVYYLDDETFSQPAMVAFAEDSRKYQCHDNGCWPGHGQQVKKWYDWHVPSSYTPPMWFLN
ncbi:unnamed protein product [Urochloa decumbens]|uniref:KIB1-4 beta-propeller domain-containing protein n=1 Tax=Urochloa decumbens TaxID=240449 RepID=A0ABC9APE6_9POAL